VKKQLKKRMLSIIHLFYHLLYLWLTSTVKANKINQISLGCKEKSNLDRCMTTLLRDKQAQYFFFRCKAAVLAEMNKIRMKIY